MILTVACGRDREAGRSAPGADPSGEPRAWSVDATQLLTIGGDGSTPLYRVADAIRLPGDTIVVADGAPRVLFFGPGGDLIRTIGREGEAPGEFRSIAWVHRVAPDTLLVYDAQLGRASWFSGDGQLERVMTPEAAPGSRGAPQLSGAFDDGALLARLMLRPEIEDPRPPVIVVRPEFRLMLYGPDGRFRNDLGAATGPELGYVHGVRFPMEFARNTLFEVAGDVFYVAPTDVFGAAVFDPSGRMIRQIEKAHAPAPFTEAGLERPRAPDGTALPRPEFFPAMSDIVADATGHVWIRPFARDETKSIDWSVFDRDGRFRGRVTLPYRFEPMDIGEDYILGVSLDSMDVETVQLLHLSRIPR